MAAKTTTTEAETPNVAKTPSEFDAAVTRGVDAWIDTHLRNSDFSRDTPAWNHFQAGLPALIESIKQEVKGL